MGVTVHGLSSLQAKLKKLDPLTLDATRRGVYKAGLAVEDDAKNNVTVVTGELKGSISVYQDYMAQGLSVSVGTNKEYAARIEFGFNDTDSLGRTYNQAAKPYLQPALQRNKKKAQEIVTKEIRNAYKGL